MKHNRGPYVITGTYFLFGFLWILFSDRFLALVTPTFEAYAAAQTYKGWFYVFVTTVLLFTMLTVYAQRGRSAFTRIRTQKVQLEEAVAEREAMMKEIHHRVKNNLQTMISILRLSRHYNRSEETRTFIEGTERRLHALALAHEQAYAGGFLSRIDAFRYLHDIVAHTRQALAGTQIQIEAVLNETPLTVDEAICCGIIVNELLDNAVRHAFSDGRSGVIRVEFRSRSTTRELVVADTRGRSAPGGPSAPGPTLSPGPPQQEPGDAAGFGLVLIQAMTDTLRGTFSMEYSDAGATATVVFESTPAP